MRLLFLLIATLLVTNSINVSFGKTYTFEEALQNYRDLGLKLPEAEQDGRIQTLNKKGAMSPVFDDATVAFINQSQGKKVLDVGGAYGKTMIECLTRFSDVTYTINDLDERHLFIAANELNNAKIEEQTLNRIRFIAKDFADINTDEKYDLVLVGRVLHFLKPDQATKVISNISQILKPGGQVFVVAITPYVKRYKSFIKVYEMRLANGVEYPGYVKSLRTWLNRNATSKSQISQISDTTFMFMDNKVLSKLFNRSGLQVSKCDMVPLKYKSASWSLDGRENVILIAKKPIAH